MKRNSKLLLIAGAAAVGLAGLTAGVVHADGRGGYGWHRPGPDRGPMMGHHGMHGSSMMTEFFKEADADKDGKLTQAEIDKARADRFAKFDANGDGKLSLDEFDNLLREVTRPMTVRAFQRLDPDGDAGITLEEYTEPFARMVERMDRDDDGALSIQDRHSRHHWRHDERGPRGHDQDEKRGDGDN